MEWIQRYADFVSHNSSAISFIKQHCRCKQMSNANAIVIRADANIAGQATGAMSYAFISSLKKNPNQSYVQLLNSIRDELEGKYDQKPQLSCSHPLSTSSTPFLSISTS